MIFHDNEVMRKALDSMRVLSKINITIILLILPLFASSCSALPDSEKAQYDMPSVFGYTSQPSYMYVDPTVSPSIASSDDSEGEVPFSFEVSIFHEDVAQQLAQVASELSAELTSSESDTAKSIPDNISLFIDEFLFNVYSQQVSGTTTDLLKYYDLTTKERIENMALITYYSNFTAKLNLDTVYEVAVTKEIINCNMLNDRIYIIDMSVWVDLKGSYGTGDYHRAYILEEDDSLAMIRYWINDDLLMPFVHESVKEFHSAHVLDKNFRANDELINDMVVRMNDAN